MLRITETRLCQCHLTQLHCRSIQNNAILSLPPIYCEASVLMTAKTAASQYLFKLSHFANLLVLNCFVLQDTNLDSLPLFRNLGICGVGLALRSHLHHFDQIQDNQFFSLHSSSQHMMPFTPALITWQVMWPPKVRHCYPGIWDHWNAKNLVIVSSEPAVSPTACVSLLTAGWTCPFPGKLSPQGLTIVSSQCILLHPARVTAQKHTLKCSSHSLKS